MNKVVYLLPSLSKSMTVYYFVLLPPLLAQKVITPAELGYIGALSIAMLVLGALIVTWRLHRAPSKLLAQVSAWTALFCSLLLLAAITTRSVALIAVVFAISGLQVGIAMSAANAILANNTPRGARYGILARGSMIGDLNRVLFPIVVAVSLGLGGLTTAVLVITAVAIGFILTANTAPDDHPADTADDSPKSNMRLWHNRPFRFILGIEFLDSFASSQLFVFIPVLFLAKGYSLQNTLLLQTAIFVGYLAGRWLIGKLASRFSGASSVAIAEVGMAVCIVLLLVAHSLPLLYALTVLLGVFARGTSPVIKALAFDSLHDQHTKRGSALHVIAGDSGSSLGQLCFGLLLAWVGVKAPFLTAATLAIVVAVVAAVFVRNKTAQ